VVTGARELAARAWWHLHPARPAAAASAMGGDRQATAEELDAGRLEALRRLLETAGRVPFYRERLAASGIEPGRLSSVAELAAVPPLERAELQRLGIAGLRVPGSRGMRIATSGSTGKPVEVLRPLELAAWIEASDRRALAWFGVRPGQRVLEVTHVHGRPGSVARSNARARMHKVAAALSNTTTLYGDQAADDGELHRVLDSIARRPPGLVRGVATTLYAVARRVEELGRPVAARVAWSGGAYLPAHHRPAIESAFSCPVYERYGSWDVGVIAHHCPEERRFHVAAESMLVEVVREDGSAAAPGELGEVLVTPLFNRATPLLRYRLGDLVEVPSGESCPCGRTLPLLGKLVGRANDLLRASDGRLVAPEAVSQQMSRLYPSVVQFQVRQLPDLTLDVKVVQRDDPPPEAGRLRLAAALDELLALPGATRVERVEEIVPAASGKLRHVWSEAGEAVAARPAGR
jgi:phenylacetate-CoA ligase